MAYEHLITADWHDRDIFTAYNAGDTARSNTVARTGSYSFRSQGANSYTLGVSSNATKYLGVAFYATSSSATMMSIRFSESATDHVTIVANTLAGTIEARRGSQTGTLLGSGGSITTNRWYFLGIKVTVNDSTGIVQVYLDGAEIFNLTSQDTKNGGTTGEIDTLYFNAQSSYVYFDDIKVRDDAIPGVGGINVYLPAGDGGDVAWTGSAGSDWECVDEAPATYTDYISTDAATTGTKSTFTHPAMAAAAYDSIDCVCAAAVVKLDASGSGNARAIVESNGSYGNGETVALSTSTKYLHSFQTVNPDGGGAWTKATVGTAEPGVETI